MDQGRRKLLKHARDASLAGAGLYLISKIPISYEQVPEIDVGLLQVPVTLDGQVEKDEWYSDSIDYESSNNVVLVPDSQPPKFHFRTKYSDYVYESFDIPTQMYTNADLDLIFDTKSTGDTSYDADGVYNLILSPLNGGGFRETDRVTVSNGSITFPGTSFYKLFKKGVDYDWAAYFGPSQLSQYPHLQFEIKVRTDILLANAKDSQINYRATIAGAGARSGLSTDSYIPMIFKQQALPEFDSEEAALLGSLVGVAAATKLAKKRLSRRDFLGISAPEKLKKQH
jgi:hypothetical protein